MKEKNARHPVWDRVLTRGFASIAPFGVLGAILFRRSGGHAPWGYSLSAFPAPFGLPLGRA